MPRTTVDLDEPLLAALKHEAAATRESMSRTVNRLLRDALRRLRGIQRKKPARLRWNTARGATPAPGFDPASRDYLDLLDDKP